MSGVPYCKQRRFGGDSVKQTLFSYLVITSIFVSASWAEFQVNTRSSNNQANAAIAMGADGNFVVVWSSYFGGGRSNDIFGQRFGADTIQIGSEFQINTATAGNQTEPSVAMDAEGNFVVTWHGPGVSEEDIFARRFDPNGQPLGDEFCVNSFTESRQQFPNVTMSAAGAFAVVWECEKVEARVICSQLYDAYGVAVGEEFEVNVLPDCRYPDAAMDANGNFAVVWMQDKSSNSIIARLYNADGTIRTEPFEVSTIDFSSLTQPSIAMAESGDFMVVWDGDPKLASLDDVHARWYKFDGTARGEQFVVNTTLAGAQQNPRVAMNSRGEFVIVWDSKIDPNVNERDIFGQRYDSSCRPIGDEFQVNTYAVDDQKYPAVAISGKGGFVTVWQSYGQDSSGYGIFGEMGQIVGSADFNGDGFVNFRDYCVLAEEWLKKDNLLRADLIEDNKIDEQDLVEFCEQWLTP